MIVDVHTHFVPEKLPNMMNHSGSERWPITRCVCGQPHHKQVMISGKSFRTITDQCWSAAKRLEDMEFEKVDMQVLSPMPELLSYWFEPKDTLEFSKHINFGLSKFIENHPERFIGLGMVPLQDPEMAAKELSKLKNNYGLKGVEVGSHINGRSIGDPFFDPFFAEAEAENMVIFIHAIHPIGRERMVGPSSLLNFIGMPTENALSVASLITSGVMEKFPNLKIYVSHGGGTISTMLPRLIHGWNMMEEIKELIPKTPDYYAKKLFYDTLVYDTRTLRFNIDYFGSSQLLIGSDYPFVIREKNPGNWISELGLTQEEKENIQYKNAFKLFGKL